MTALVDEIVSQIRTLVRQSAIGRDGSINELRREFHGPPLEILEEVFRKLTANGGLEIESSLGSIAIPVVLQVERLEPASTPNPTINGSGICLAPHILDKRNSPDCPRFVALVPPGRQSGTSVKSAADYFGLSAKNNSGNATIEDWWRDDFIQSLVQSALRRGKLASEIENDQALLLIRNSIFAADEADRHDIARNKAWAVLSRLFEIPTDAKPFGKFVSLACGYPPTIDGSIRVKDQEKVLGSLADKLVELTFKPAISDLKQRATEEDVIALEEFLAHLIRVCDISASFDSSTSYFYSPSQNKELSQPPPNWWEHLTVERWIELLDEEHQPEQSLTIECENSLIPTRKGVPALVLDEVAFKAKLPVGMEGPIAVTITRESGPAASRPSWCLELPDRDSLTDDNIASHRAPIRYAVTADSFQKGAAKAISLKSWEPGVFAFSQTAKKISTPKKAKANRDKVALEAHLELAGIGRHYIDLYVSPNIAVNSIAASIDSEGVVAETVAININRATNHSFGFEIDATSECFCDILFDRGRGEEIFRLNLVCDEVTAVGCSSEFERLIALNRARSKNRVTSEIEINRQLRSFDLQTWILDAKNVDRSHFPLVVGPDLNEAWRSPDWSELTGSILSKGKFLNDPRPTPELMSPPPAFTAARSAIAALIRGDEEEGLLEISKLGEWLTLPSSSEGLGSFADLLDKYLASYFSWLEAEPSIAAWADVILVTSLDRDGITIIQEPDAIILSPLHPVRLGWQALAQKCLYQSYRANSPCPAASILDAGRVPDALVLPFRTASGGLKSQKFIAVECSSDYWGVLWGSSRLDARPARTEIAPFDREFGIQVGGASSGFSVSQVGRALNDVTSMLGAKPVISVAISSAAGRNNACDEGLLSWCRGHFGNFEDRDDEQQAPLGPRLLQIFDDRQASARPDDTALANLSEDTSNSVRWFNGVALDSRPDLGIIAQLESAAPSVEKTDTASPVGVGALIRHRVRQQLPGGNRAFLSESRMSVAGPPSGDSLSDRLTNCVVRLENLESERLGYTFAPSVHSIQAMLKDKDADFVAVSSSAVDPACFLGGWLEDAYLWDYHLPSYSQRAGDTNGYYLLSKVKEIDRETLKKVLNRLPGGSDVSDEVSTGLILEVARRGIPTIRGLSGGDSSATGDLGLFIAARLLQDEFRTADSDPGLLPVLSGEDESQLLSMIIPVDPFKGYLEDFQNTFSKGSGKRPDFLVVGIEVTDSLVKCKLTPIEVKYRNGLVMTAAQSLAALEQAKSLSSLLKEIQEHAERSDLVLWKIAFQHLVISMLSYGFRVYSQQRIANERARIWASNYQRIVSAVLADEVHLSIDSVGRLIIIDSTAISAPRDIDNDGFKETVTISPHDASRILYGDPTEFYSSLRSSLGHWNLMPVEDQKNTAASRVKPSAYSPEMTIRNPATTEAILAPQSEAKDTAVQIQPSSTASEEQEKQDAPVAQVQTEVFRSSDQDGMTLLVGSTVDTFQRQQRYLDLSNTKLNQLNIGVVGDLGTGKTQFLKSMIWQIAKAKSGNGGVQPRFLIFDYKKDYSSEDFVKATGATLRSPFELPLNLFDISGSADGKRAWLGRYQFFSDVLDKIYPGIGPVQRQDLKRAVKAAYDSCQNENRHPTIYDVHHQYCVLREGKADSIFSILDDLVDTEIFSRTPSENSGFSEFFQGVVVIKLNELGQDDRIKNMLVAVMLNMFYEHMLTIPKRPYRGTETQLRTVDSFLLVDEANNILQYEFDVLKKILLQGREFGVGVVLASQYLRHFKVGATDYREPLLSWFIHKVPNVIPQELSALGFTSDVAQLSERVKVLPNHHCLFKTANVTGEVIDGLPFFKLIAGSQGSES